LPEEKWKVAPLSAENPRTVFGASLRPAKFVFVMLFGIVALFVAACGGRAPDDSSNDASHEQSASAASSEESVVEETTVGKADASSEVVELAKAEVGEHEITNMMPAGGEKPDAARPLPENPPQGIEVYPATTNASVEGPIDYDRHPPTNGDHAPIWQNCGFYEQPIEDKHAVHSMDHGVVWITYRPNLPEQQIRALRPYGNENYVIASPYPGQDAPVTATSWRVQLELDSPKDPRLRRFVNQFRISELAPLSGNRCNLGVGSPKG
jgi:hypothetical protein